MSCFPPFAKRQGTGLRLSDEYGQTLYDTLPSEADALENSAENVTVVTQESEMPEPGWAKAYTEAGDVIAAEEAVIHQLTVTQAYLSAGKKQAFFFRDGTMGC